MGFFSRKKKETKPAVPPAPPAASLNTRPAPRPEAQDPMTEDKAKLLAQMLSMYMKEED